jgi:NAD(P)-binding Rossmann-like domain
MGRGQRVKRRTVLASVAAPALLGLSACDSKVTGVIDGGFVGASIERGHSLRSGAPPWAGAKAANPEQKTDVLIVGGGVAGLSAARACVGAQREFALMELEDQLGGNARGHLMRAGSMSVPCPLGAHYLPVPNDHAHHTQDWLIDLGLAERSAARFQLNRQGLRHLCHSPQERLFINGGWQEGLLPEAEKRSETAQHYAKFAARVNAFRATGQFQVPWVHFYEKNKAWPSVNLDLFAMTFDDWLRGQGLSSAELRWYLDYCCRDEYGAGLSEVSAWAGIQYFASRHGFAAGASDGGDRVEGEGVLTWPQGNAWLTEDMRTWIAGKAGEQVFQTGRMAVAVQEQRDHVEVRAWHFASKTVQTATPLRVAARLMPSHTELQTAAKALPTSAWIVANVALAEPLHEGPFTPEQANAPGAWRMHWDNVIYRSQALGYVNALHQGTTPHITPTVLTWYKALGSSRQAALQSLEQAWTHWRDEVLHELAVPHPDLRRKAQRIDVARYGHAMAVPAVGVAQSVLSGPLAALRRRGLSQRIKVAHSDLAGYSVMEEAVAVGALALQRA